MGQSTPRFPTSRHFPSSAPAFQPQPPQDRNVFNFQPFPNIYDPFRNFYNLANYPPQKELRQPQPPAGRQQRGELEEGGHDQHHYLPLQKLLLQLQQLQHQQLQQQQRLQESQNITN